MRIAFSPEFYPQSTPKRLRLGKNNVSVNITEPTQLYPGETVEGKLVAGDLAWLSEEGAEISIRSTVARKGLDSLQLIMGPVVTLKNFHPGAIMEVPREFELGRLFSPGTPLRGSDLLEAGREISRRVGLWDRDGNFYKLEEAGLHRIQNPRLRENGLNSLCGIALPIEVLGIRQEECLQIGNDKNIPSDFDNGFVCRVRRDDFQSELITKFDYSCMVLGATVAPIEFPTDVGAVIVTKEPGWKHGRSVLFDPGFGRTLYTGWPVFTEFHTLPYAKGNPHPAYVRMILYQG